MRWLLIVPYGIETRFRLNFDTIEFLLIVPYGIETFEVVAIKKKHRPFNRTLWN